MFDLESITDPSFIKKLSIKELNVLAQEIREFLVDNISKTGGHLSSNLGVVEITIAMYYVFDPKKDKFLFDVGHQSYVHKILTGRAKDFVHLRQIDGMSGYIRRSESEYDVWESGHSSTSISAASGMILANSDSRVVSVIGDSSGCIYFLRQLQFQRCRFEITEVHLEHYRWVRLMIITGAVRAFTGTNVVVHIDKNRFHIMVVELKDKQC